MLRPSMSRVIATLSGDTEVGTVPSKPGYLTEWNFSDMNSFASDNQSLRTDASHFASSVSTNTVHSPMDTTKPMLNEITGDVR